MPLEDTMPAHRAALVSRCALLGSVLVVQGRAVLNCKGIQDWTRQLPDSDRGSAGKRTVPVHAAFAVAEDGAPLGVLWLRPWNLGGRPGDSSAGSPRGVVPWVEGYRSAVEFGKEAKGARVVYVGDPQGDFAKLFQSRQGSRNAAGIVLRPARAGQRPVVARSGSVPLRKHLSGLRPVSTGYSISTRGRSERNALVEIRADMVQFKQTGGRGKLIRAQAVLVTEPAPPSKKRPLEWLLVASEGKATAGPVLRTVRRYDHCRVIKEYFTMLKSGRKSLNDMMSYGSSRDESFDLAAVHTWTVFRMSRILASSEGTPSPGPLGSDSSRLSAMLREF